MPYPADRCASFSASLYDRARSVMPGGCSRNTILRLPHPIYAVKGEGCRVTDVDGRVYIDFSGNMASLIHGHAHPDIVAAVSDQVSRGSAFALGTEQEILYAEHLIGRVESYASIRFVNSGTEAVMSCIKAARAFTGRPKIAKVEGSYHGQYDYAEVSQTARPDNWGSVDSPCSVPVAAGTPQSALDDVVVIPFNDTERAIPLLDAHRGEIACILIDPVPHRIGVICASSEFIRALRAWASSNGSVFVFDEVITFRLCYGGVRECFDVEPDLTALGKMIGGGFPVGAVAGRADVMEVMDPHSERFCFPHSGTFSANPVTMTAGYVAMRLFDRGAVERLNRLGAYARKGLTEAIGVSGVPACVTGAGSMFRIHLRVDPPASYRDVYASAEERALIEDFVSALGDRGFVLINTCSGFLSTPMKEEDIDQLSDAVCSVLIEFSPRIERVAGISDGR